MWATWMNLKDTMIRKHANHIKKTTAWLPLHEAPGGVKISEKLYNSGNQRQWQGRGESQIKEGSGFCWKHEEGCGDGR
jgi:hypothetical protein